MVDAKKKNQQVACITQYFLMGSGLCIFNHLLTLRTCKLLHDDSALFRQLCRCWQQDHFRPFRPHLLIWLDETPQLNK